MSSSQSEEQTMFFTREKKRIRPIRSANDISSCAREMIHPIKSQSDVWVSRQNSCLLHVRASQDFAHIQRENLYVEAIKKSFTRRKVKSETSCKLKWNSLVYFTVDTINEDSRQNNSRRGKQKETQTGKSKDGNFTVYLCLQLCFRPCTDYVYTLYTILSLLLPSSPWFLF